MIRTLTLSTFFLATIAHAQPTLTASMLPSGTYTDQLYVVTSQGQSQSPTPGINQTWDLSTATLQNIGTFTHQPASASPYASTYPTANIAWHMNMGFLGNNYTYFTSGTALDMVATDVPEDPNVYTDHLRVLAFPMSIGNSFTDTWAGSAGSGSVTWTYAGHGTAHTPVGSFSNVVLLVSNTSEVALWRTSPLVPLLLIRDGMMLAVGPTGVGIQEQASASISVYPVPCTDQLMVQSTSPSPWHIVDTQGRTVLEGRFSTIGTQAVATERLVPGTYVLVQLAPEGRRTARFSKQ